MPVHKNILQYKITFTIGSYRENAPLADQIKLEASAGRSRLCAGDVTISYDRLA